MSGSIVNINPGDLRNKRLAAVDYGKKRTGIAICDEFHIAITPKNVLDPGSPDFWENLLALLTNERIFAVIVGVPLRLDGAVSELTGEINNFISELREKSNLIVIPFDESFTTKRAVKVLLEIGAKKKRRSARGTKDLIAAAIILREFLNEMENIS